jgi:GT2 family glycosyltransferase
VRRDIANEPLVSVLVPFRDKAALLEKCLDSVLAKTDYANFEIVGIDNASAESATHRLMDRISQRDGRVRFIRYDAPFNFSAINNFAAKHARGEHLVFLNNDTEVISHDWMRAMLEHSQRVEVGVVGAKLLYSDGAIQHAGVILGLGGVAGHSHLMSPAHHHGYFSRPQLIQNVSAVTFACAMARKAVFDELQGLNESELAIAFNDVDFCLRAREAGYLVVYTPYAELYHHESKSRGYETDPAKRERLARETAYMRQRHREILEKGDPYYNPNLSLTNNFEPNPRYADELPL